MAIYLSNQAGMLRSDKAREWGMKQFPNGSDSPAIVVNHASNVLFGEDMVPTSDPETGKPAERSSIGNGLVDDVDPASRSFDVV